ncbi:hypothetical protein FSPOR_3214 [Fusarium sporotrichioides]|uniref:Bzip transcription factor n=1 Tax=Fusarium sporotrichioides TaxID=5514 RepID=A0A395SGJ1_FUSSP|nr:hypothetical protein FSPOR_3214 [Fusarium sporotrichioides]
MPRKARTPESLALNRENQRRSRARQRELLDDLQGRVREYERRDAQATLEMQRVARVVAGENAALRALLAAKGVAPEEVESHLDAVRHEDKTTVKIGVSSFTPVSTPSSATSPVVIPSRPVPFIQSQCQPTGCGPVQESSNPPINFQPMMYSPPTPSTTTMNTCTEESGCCPRPQPPPSTMTMNICNEESGCCPRPQPPSQPQPQPQLEMQPEVQHPRSIDKIHCMEAATILAQIKGHSDISNARAVLGCGPNDSCMVRNTDLLTLMDEMT